MRVTSNTYSDNLLSQLGGLTARQGRLQTQAATGQRILSPEDDPVAMRRALDLQTEAGANTQFLRNITRQQELAAASFSNIKALKTVLDRAGEIATKADGLASPDELQAYATEVTQLIHHAARLMNATHGGGYLFAGTRSDQPPFVIVTGAEGRVSSVSYQGNTAVSETEVASGAALTAQVVGANAAGVGTRGVITDSRSGADLFAHLISLQDHLAAGDTAGIAADQENLRSDEDNILFHLSANGAVQARLEAAAAMARDRGLSIEKQLSREADADLAETLVKLSQTQTAYQAALQSGARVMSVSLLDYLR